MCFFLYTWSLTPITHLRSGPHRWHRCVWWATGWCLRAGREPSSRRWGPAGAWCPPSCWPSSSESLAGTSTHTNTHRQVTKQYAMNPGDIIQPVSQALHKVRVILDNVSHLLIDMLVRSKRSYETNSIKSATGSRSCLWHQTQLLRRQALWGNVWQKNLCSVEFLC